MKRIGIHIRLEDGILSAIKKAKELNISTFQNFFVTESGKYINPTDDEVKLFLEARKNFKNLFAHSSFWINLANSKKYNLRLLKKELDLANKLQYNYLIIHPGSAKEYETKEEGINVLAKKLNTIFKDTKNVTILLENTAHGKKTIGNDLNDFKALQEKVDFQLNYCIDTAHAYSYGYDIKNNLDAFIKLLDETVGIDNIKLIHLNETSDELGSKHDKHALINNGNIGTEILNKIYNNPNFKNIDFILELPPKATTKEELESLEFFKK